MGTVILVHGITASGRTWWRLGPDLAELGWTVHTPDLPGHGERAAPAPSLTMTQLADDVADRFPDGCDLLVGHSLGAAVAATIAASRPGWCRGMVLEDPPGLNGEPVSDAVAEGYLDNARRARSDPQATRAQLRADNPLWAPADVDNAVWGRAHMDIDVMGASVAGSQWDLPALVATADVPLFVIAAEPDRSILQGPDRDALFAAATQTRVVDSGHNVHRDRPALWLAEVTRFAREHGLGQGSRERFPLPPQ